MASQSFNSFPMTSFPTTTSYNGGVSLLGPHVPTPGLSVLQPKPQSSTLRNTITLACRVNQPKPTFLVTTNYCPHISLTKIVEPVCCFVAFLLFFSNEILSNEKQHVAFPATKCQELCNNGRDFGHIKFDKAFERMNVVQK